MKLKSLFSALLLGCAMMAQAQSANDPTIMTINGQPISRSEFEYSYNKSTKSRWRNMWTFSSIIS